MKGFVFCCALLCAAASVAAQETILRGTYISTKLGWIASQNSDERFEVNANPGVLNENRITLRRKGRNGFAVNAALGVRLDLGLPIWLRSEVEIGFERYEIAATISTTPARQERNRSQMISFIWHSYVHPLDRSSPHQIFLGLGMGGAFARARLSQGQRQGRERGIATFNGNNFVLISSLGYDYRILERSRFSSEYLSLGITGRFLFAEGFRRELTTHVLAVLTYGF